VPFLALDPEAHNVAFVEVELCVIVPPDVDLFVLFAAVLLAEAKVECSKRDRSKIC
jgi:hypothetical protein